MCEAVTKWGILKFASYKEAAAAEASVMESFKKIRLEARWGEIIALAGFTALADQFSMLSADTHPIVYAEADLVWWADLDLRERDNVWQLREFCHYKINGKKYRVESGDFRYGFNMNDVEWDGEEEERGGDWKEVKASTTVYLVCTNKQLAERAI
jgi:hypothetical protein